MPGRIEGLKRSTLIGANKVFGILDDLALIVRNHMYREHGIINQGKTPEGREVQSIIDLRTGYDFSLIVDSVEDPNHYSYKNLYLRSPGQETLFLRATSTYNFGGISTLNAGKAVRIKTTSKKLLGVLERFGRLHNDIGEGDVRFNVSLPFDADVSALV